MKKPNDLKRDIFLRYMLSYTLVLSVSIFLLLAFGSRLLSNKQKEAIDRSARSMTQYVDQIEDRFVELSNVTRMVSSDMDTRAILQQGRARYYDCYQLSRRLQNYAQANAFIKNIFVLVKDEDLVVGSNGVITGMDKFYRIVYNGDLRHLDQWKEQCWGTYRGEAVADQVWAEERMLPTILYSWPVLTTNGQDPKQWRILVYIDESELDTLIPADGEMIDFSILHSNGDTIWSKQGHGYGTELESIEISQSSISGRNYLGIFQEDRILAEWNLLYHLLMWMIVGCCLLGGGFCILMAWYNSRPIANMAQVLAQNSAPIAAGQRNVYKHMQDQLADLVADRKDLEEEIARRFPILQATFIERLLHGTLEGSEDPQRTMLDLKIPLTGERYCVAVFAAESFGTLPDGEQSPSMVKIVLEQILAGLAGENIYICSGSSTDWGTSVIFALQPGLTAQQISCLCEQVAVFASSEYGIRLRCGVGQDHPDLADISLSYAQANKALDSCDPACGPQVLLYTPGFEGLTSYYFPIELEQKLLRATVNGNARLVADTFQEVEKENMRSNHLSREMVRLLTQELEGCYLKALAMIPRKAMQDPAFPAVLPHKSAKAPRDLDGLRAQFLALAQYIQNANYYKKASFYENIKSYVDHNFTDMDLSLSVLAERFHVTEVYMSRQFKENVGITFSQYLEKCRMEHAGAMLREGKPVSVVAVACGYQSPHTFRRAYKRYYGNLPSDEKKLQ